jgi:hypothetical protein
VAFFVFRFRSAPFNLPPLPPHSSDLHAGLGALSAHRAAVGVDVPLDLLAVVDDGGSPDAFTAAAFRRGNRANQLVAGRAAVLGALRDALVKAATQEYPVASAAYEAATK